MSGKALQLVKVLKHPFVFQAMTIRDKALFKLKSTRFYKELDETIKAHFDTSGVFGMRNMTVLAILTYVLIFYTPMKIVKINKAKDKQARIDLKKEIVLQALARAGIKS